MAEEVQVGGHSGEVAGQQGGCSAQGDEGQNLAGCTAAYGGVVLELPHTAQQAASSLSLPGHARPAGQPAHPEPRQAQGFGNTSQGDGPVVHVTGGVQPVSRVQF
eukprot:CAMPEP_0202918094 /NCGR_PEP_ID=MMETSP1392-20130828/72648_1 /ASSEMBLY_ACC=CAM_ASM_000868 /TAXON_ID=225041 /ORGANISM="Chlamydomonas chlamydogama, Strain SAG 11-48b" /LENGTH=104 /DNA_ID=CAMNT_0049611045 /DNA_START=142 /DNA_END=456 /DNA_ORIENTATION=-